MILLDKEKHIMALIADCQMNKRRYCVVFKCEIRRAGPVKLTQEELGHLPKLH